MSFFNRKVICLVFFFGSACSSIEDRNYHDTRHLEVPPDLEVEQSIADVGGVREPSIATTSKDNIVLDDTIPSDHKIIIRQNFDRSWHLVNQALETKDFNIKDKNRDKGMFFIKFDPDDFTDRSWFVSAVNAVLFIDEFESVLYRLNVQWNGYHSEVGAEPDLPENTTEQEKQQYDEHRNRLIKEIYYALMVNKKKEYDAE